MIDDDRFRVEVDYVHEENTLGYPLLAMGADVRGQSSLSRV